MEIDAIRLRRLSSVVGSANAAALERTRRAEHLRRPKGRSLSMGASSIRK